VEAVSDAHWSSACATSDGKEMGGLIDRLATAEKKVRFRWVLKI
jgi:hypothetical protein